MEDGSKGTAPNTRTDAQPQGTVSIRRKSLLVAFVVSVGCIALAYGIGRVQTAARITDARAKTVEATRQGESKAHALEAELTALRQKLLRLEASRQLYLSLVALDQRNFGIAQQRLQEASQLLAQSAPPQGGALAQLAKTMDESNLVATENISAQRDQVLRWATELDALVPPPRLK
jgi:hypothetical protein